MDNNEELPSFENYQVLRELGRGGMGVVYLAEDKRLNRQVALKVIHAAKVHSISKDQIINEAKILANLNHANIVHLYDIVEEHDSIALVMEYVDGIDLKRAIVEQYASLEQKIIWLRQIAQALEYAHDHNILHRDIKPENILVSNSNIAKLSDFGISEVISGTPTRSFKEHSQNKSEKFSSLLTLAPEEINGASVDTKSDLFSLGCVCYTLLCGKHPFVTGSVINKNEIIKNILHNEPINPKDFNPNIPAEICTLVVSLLQKEKSKRPLNAADVVGRLVAHEKNPSGLNDVDLTETLPTSELYKAPTGFPVWLKSALAMLVFVVCCVTGYWIYDSRPIEKKYVAIYEPALWDSEGVSDIEKDLYLSASVWIREYLLAHPNVSVLETSVAEKPGISIEDFFKQTAADEVVVNQIKCTQDVCNLSLRLISSEVKSIKHEVNYKFSKNDKTSMNSIVGKFVSNLGDDSVETDFGDIESNESDMNEYLNLYFGFSDGSIAPDRLLERIESLHYKIPGFLSVYDLWINVLTSKYYDSLNETYLKEIKRVISIERKFYPSHYQAFLHELHLYVIERKFEEAFEIVQSIEKTIPFDEQVLAAYAYYYTNLGDYAKASSYYEKLIDLRPNLDMYFNAAVNSWQLSDFEKLDNYLDSILDLDPNNLRALKLLAAGKLSRGFLDQAAEIYNNLLLINNLDTEVRNNLGLVYFLRGDYSSAYGELSIALNRNPNDLSIRLNYVENLFFLELNETLEGELKKLIKLTEGDNSILGLRVRAQVFAHKGNYKKAVEIMRELQFKYPDNVEVMLTGAIVYTLAGDRYSALTSFEKAANSGLGQVWLKLPWFKPLCENKPDNSVFYKINCQDEITYN